MSEKKMTELRQYVAMRMPHALDTSTASWFMAGFTAKQMRRAARVKARSDGMALPEWAKSRAPARPYLNAARIRSY